MEKLVRERAEKWLNSQINEASKAEIKHLLQPENQKELIESFYKNLEFGTGGLRGIMGIGTNRVNIYTIGMATQGLANYLLKSFPNQTISVVVAHDSRNNSKLFAETTANVFSANGIKVYFFSDLRPTPELSFAIRHLGCQSGVVLTASHNPKEYNGYKAYWNDGAQITPPHDSNVIEEVNKIANISDVKFNRVEQNITLIGEEIDKLYLEQIKKLSLKPSMVKEQHKLKIIFSSIHGTGITLVPQALANLGFDHVHIVEEQAIPDGNFPTVVYPNPEEKEAMTLALKTARKIDADLVLATDPDADRVGIAVKNFDGEYQLLNGNQTGTIIIYYILKKMQENKSFKEGDYIVKTIVTTDLWESIAQHFGIECMSTLTGFKYIASIIRELEGQRRFIVGGEESYGYMISDFVRDKDAVAACAMIAEVAAYAKSMGISLFEMLVDIYSQFGFYKEDLVSLTKKGMDGVAEINHMMKNLRENPPKSIQGSAVLQMLDYENAIALNVKTGASSKLNYPKSNVLQFITEDGTKVSARPSGTEPKIKFYFSVKEPLTAITDYEMVEKKLEAKIKGIIEEMGLK